MSRPALEPADSGYYSSGVKKLRREADQSPLFSAEGWKECLISLRFQILTWFFEWKHRDVLVT